MKILVATASRYGATTEITDALADRLREHGHECVTLSPEHVTDVAGYDAAVLASGVYVGRWLKPARKMLKRYGAQFAAMPVWLISSGPVGDPLRPAEDPVNVAALLEQTKALKHVVLPGRIDVERLSKVDRAMVAALRVPEGDYRDWDEVRELADEINSDLASRG